MKIKESEDTKEGLKELDKQESSSTPSFNPDSKSIELDDTPKTPQNNVLLQESKESGNNCGQISN